jgi:hypothetical protein
MEQETLLQYVYDNPNETYDHYGLPVATIDGAEYAIATSEEEAETACAQYIEQSVWAFNASFLASHIEALNEDDIERLRGDKCEDVNDALLKLIDDFDYFVEDAIGCDGLGHFLATYDGEYTTIGDYHLFRIN